MELITYLASLSLGQVLTGVATSVGVLMVVVLAIAPGLFELWERWTTRSTDRAHCAQADAAAATVVPLRAVTARSTRDHYHRAA